MDFSAAVEELVHDQLQVIFIPIFLAAMLGEMIIDRQRHLGLYKGRDTWASLGMLLITGVVELFPKILAIMAFYALHTISPLADIVGRQWWAWIVLFLLDDMTYYWFHRMNHEIRILWAGHVSHHSSRYLNFATALRQGAGERIHKYLFWCWLALLGFDPIMMFTMISINLIYQFWVHTELVGRLPAWVEYVFNTPSHHRVHHASNVRYLDCNHAGVLIIWDRIFGTFSKELDEEKPVYGLTKNIHSHNPLYVASHEYGAIWRDISRADKWMDKLKYMFYAPGWSHDGEDLRARSLRAKGHTESSTP